VTQRHRILAIDRAQEIARLGEVQLEDLDVDLSTVDHGQQGLELARRQRPDLILLGVGLTDMSGFEVCRRLREDPRTRGVRVIFVTGSNDPDDKLRGLDLGAVDYVTKPYHPAELKARVRLALQTKAMFDALRAQARTDSLTGLPNRAQLTERLREAVERSRRDPDYGFALLFLDFDRFKIINDSLGHDAGDMLLIGIARRLTENLRPTDGAYQLNHLPARLGGDEFVILLDEINDTDAAIAEADKLQEVLSKSHIVGDHKVTSTASIGIVVCNGQYEYPDNILRDADTAMYHAKAKGRAQHEVFDARMHQEAVDRLNLEEELRHAVENEEFVLDYQPIVALENGRLGGFEALIRWSSADVGAVSRPEYIPLAEEIGLIVPIGQWVLSHAAGQLARWQAEYPRNPPLTMNVNVSRRQLTHPDFAESVRHVISAHDLAPHSLKLEITESVIMDHLHELTPVLQQLRSLGVQLCLDDFGTGHSSLSCLHLFPTDVLKIDRSFLQNMDVNRSLAAVTHAIVTLAHNLGMNVVAEGVESPGQLAQLQALECDYAQGYYFSKSLTAKGASAFIESREHFSQSA
jgi:diguanylate cyclase (GGDEF)-like protein